MTAVRKSVFGSAAEREHFGHLVEKWSKQSNVYHNLPFLQVFDLEKLVKILRLDEIAISRLKKTSIDFVLCDKNDKPWVGIDFDGLNEGFSSGASYVDYREFSKWRKEIFTLKLNAAHQCGFPYVIARSAQFKLLPGEAKLTVVDGVIGSVLTNLSLFSKICG